MISPVTNAEKCAELACAPMAENIKPVPTTSMLTPLSNEASGRNRLPKRMSFALGAKGST